MRELGALWPPHDGVAVFNRVYLSVTEEIERRLGHGAFENPRATAAFDIRFAARYLHAVDPTHPDPPACWRALLRARHHRTLLPLQFALAGINAHVGHDLALAIVDTCDALRCEPEAIRGAFDQVGNVLTALEERIREELMPGPDPLEAADPLTHLLGCWSLARARDAAWAAGRALWALRHLPAVTEEFAERLDGAVALVGQTLLTPLPMGRSAEGSCAERPSTAAQLRWPGISSGISPQPPST
jgi:AcrR family transcriptional regulator